MLQLLVFESLVVAEQVELRAVSTWKSKILLVAPPRGPPMDARSRITKTTYAFDLCDQNSSIGDARNCSRSYRGYFSHQRGFKDSSSQLDIRPGNGVVPQTTKIHMKEEDDCKCDTSERLPHGRLKQCRHQPWLKTNSHQGHIGLKHLVSPM